MVDKGQQMSDFEDKYNEILESTPKVHKPTRKQLQQKIKCQFLKNRQTMTGFLDKFKSESRLSTNKPEHELKIVQ